MYLTDKKKLAPREMDDHEELEFLLESFSKQVEEIVSEVGNIDVRCFFADVTGACPNICLEQRAVHPGDRRANLGCQS